MPSNFYDYVVLKCYSKQFYRLYLEHLLLVYLSDFHAVCFEYILTL